MIVFGRHTKNIGSLKEEEILDIHKSLTRLISIIKNVLHPDGFNIGINIGKFAGAGVENHFHIHVVPRWKGDTNFMPITSSTKVISQSLKELFYQIKKIV